MIAIEGFGARLDEQVSGADRRDKGLDLSASGCPSLMDIILSAGL